MVTSPFAPDMFVIRHVWNAERASNGVEGEGRGWEGKGRGGEEDVKGGEREGKGLHLPYKNPGSATDVGLPVDVKTKVTVSIYISVCTNSDQY